MGKYRITRYEDNYLDKMGDLFSSDAFKVIFPEFHDVSFEEWLYILELEKRREFIYGNQGYLSSRIAEVYTKFVYEI